MEPHSSGPISLWACADSQEHHGGLAQVISVWLRTGEPPALGWQPKNHQKIPWADCGVPRTAWKLSQGEQGLNTGGNCCFYDLKVMEEPAEAGWGIAITGDASRAGPDAPLWIMEPLLERCRGWTGWPISSSPFQPKQATDLKHPSLWNERLQETSWEKLTSEEICYTSRTTRKI